MTSFANIRGTGLRCAASGLALIVALGSAPSFAQVVANGGETAQSPTDPLADDIEGEILVTGTRASLQSAIARKKNADTVVDSIVAEDIASFPDKNVGEALARVTGVQLIRNFGEGEQVSIRGVEPDLNRVEINGVSQQSPGGGRSGDFRELAVELVKSIDVYKGYSVDLTEGGIGGTVRVETRRPLELTKPLFSVKGEAQRLNLTEKWRPRFNLTAGENVAVGRIAARDDEARIVRAAERGLADAVIARLALAYDQPLGKLFAEGVDLSGGQWQKIALSRAYMREAEILILDEPTAALDARAEFEVFRRFRDLGRGRTAVLISHRFSTVRMADRILVLEGGRVLESGTHAELQAAGGRYAELFELQAAGYR